MGNRRLKDTNRNSVEMGIRIFKDVPREIENALKKILLTDGLYDKIYYNLSAVESLGKIKSEVEDV